MAYYFLRHQRFRDHRRHVLARHDLWLWRQRLSLRGFGNDHLYGGSGNDDLVGGSGINTL